MAVLRHRKLLERPAEYGFVSAMTPHPSRPATILRPDPVTRRGVLAGISGGLALLGSGMAIGADEQGPLRVAVAANFLDTARRVGAAFTAAGGGMVEFSSGSTGQLFAQITQGAPFDLFLAADRERPAAAAAAGLVADAGPFTYAIGRLALVSSAPDIAPSPERLLTDGGRVAIANPDTAPYGRAAVEVMDALGLTDPLAGRLVRGTSVGQAFQFVESGNAAFGFIAASQIAARPDRPRWPVPEDLHTPIRQDGAVLAASRQPEAAARFAAFLQGDAAAAILRADGYRTGAGA
ncbi:molybdate ABC transporter substrate-binding protein [Oceanomicrobium pacificus]|uniref:Molybdate ABC transporter substrate-binding protein n=1 Tax=Oceanomicrobium pacificus TaxID=2692916 RepID=A0A6B0TZA0_9RHOB|nr:molybdate ABC transporter substrate-binding protein [Oceanomicrobium pacificus]MXU66602.1 molybdate ABC transporter substrate-binding protein [Oceanomicrobium pacificus]